MKVSFGRFDGDTVLFIKPDDAIELVKISGLLGLDLKALEPKQARIQGMVGKPVGFKHEVSTEHECFYCGKTYKVSINRKKAWRYYCSNPKCRSQYARDRRLYKSGKLDELNKLQLMRNLQAQGVKVKFDRRGYRKGRP